MVPSTPNITDKKYQKLTLQVALDRLSFCCLDTLNNKVLALEEIDFAHYPNPTQIEDCLKRVFQEHAILQNIFDEVIVLHDSNLSALVPSALFDENYLGSYLQYNTKVFETDFFAYDVLSNYEINNIYIPYVNINNFIIDQLGSFDYKHVHSVLVTTILDISKNRDDKQVFVHFKNQHFEIIVVQNQKLLLFNSFEYKTPEDFLYYLLFTAEQLNLNPENFKLQLFGDLQEESEYYQLAYKYIRNITLLDSSLLQRQNNLSSTEILKHFILLQS
ncbi:DUF3822 family protein [Flavobacterium sp. '19STA2R22 D10 B1']|uniref:DUF3822 family protein n=1 Tax=Flavobacterium aerium TaxID=3037261 RepID=UPI00278BC713|nr:DUF3822 family protein [Flavobacterium sp. '19STA2R22 D10 B1']